VDRFFNSIFRRIAAGYAATLLVLSAAGAVGVYTVHGLQQEVFELIKLDVPALQALLHLTNEIYREEI